MNFKDFYDKEEGHMILLKNVAVSEALAYHLERKLTLCENHFRIYSPAYFDLISEARDLYNQDLLSLNEDDAELVQSNLGEKGVYEGREVYLEAPISYDEDLITEAIAVIPHNSIHTKIFVDMDGVLCDLYNVISTELGKPINELTRQDYAGFFKSHEDDADKVFANLPKYDSADFLIKIVNDLAGEYYICSAQLKNHDSTKVIAGKNQWLDNNLEDQPAGRIFTREKYKHATTDGKPNILIDDWNVNIDDWNDAGGIGILYSAEKDGLDTLIEKLLDAKEILDNRYKGVVMTEAKARGKNVKLNRPFRTPGGPKKFAVYVKTPKGTVKKVTFGDPNMRVRNASKARAKSFRARHKCSQKKDRTTAGYWSCNISRYRKALGLKSSRAW
jgi:hypothetical protein